MFPSMWSMSVHYSRALIDGPCIAHASFPALFTVARTDCNDQSSRSHLVALLTVTGTHSVTGAVLFVVDLSSLSSHQPHFFILIQPVSESTPLFFCICR